MYQQLIKSGNGDINRAEHHEGDGFKVRTYLDFINNRMKVKSFSGENKEGMTKYVIKLASRYNFGKLLFNATEELSEVLEREGFILEGSYPGFFNGTTAYGYSYYFKKDRQNSPYLQKEDQILESIFERKKSGTITDTVFPADLKLRIANEDDIEHLVKLYSEIFSTYPSPLLNPSYVGDCMKSNVLFVGAFDGEQPVSAASVEMDLENMNAEITDCATLSEFRAKGLLTLIITKLEELMYQREINCLYSLARAGSYGMNASLYNLGYKYTGRFINNCHIGGRFENMNLWVK